MFAIVVSDETMPKIRQSSQLTDKDKSAVEQYCLNRPRSKYYVITGYVTRRGMVMNWTFLPHHLFEKNFEFDPEKIKTDWDQIVRK